MAQKPRDVKTPAAVPAPLKTHSRAVSIAALILTLYAAALVYARGRIPPGLNNDAAEERPRISK